MNRLHLALLLGAGLPLLAAIIVVADRRGFLRTAAFPSPLRRRLALGLFFFHLVLTVLAPAVAGTRRIDVSGLGFSQVVLAQGLLAAFLAAWWLLAGRPPLGGFLGLSCPDPLREAGRGVLLGVGGWGATLAIGVAVSLVGSGLGIQPTGVSPLLRWIVGQPLAQRLAVVAMAMTLEEFYYRAFLQSRLGAVVASILFLLAHAGYGDLRILVVLLGVTVILAVAYQRSGSAIAPIFAHGTFDAIQLFIVAPAVLRHLPVS